MEQKVVVSEVINRICDELKYTRAHVANLLRQNAETLNATMVAGHWHMPEESVEKLRQIVIDNSGPRYKLGEKGSRT